MKAYTKEMQSVFSTAEEDSSWTSNKSQWQCQQCPGKPGLCPGKCFKVFHTVLDY